MSNYGLEKALPSVPRSKGCLTCVSRKKRCDGRRPTCRACENRNQTCAGYRREPVVFLNEGWRALGVASKTHGKKVKEFNCTNQSAHGEDDEIVADLVLYPSPTADRFHLHIAFLNASFGTRPFQTFGCSGHLFRHYLHLLSSSSLSGDRRHCSPSEPAFHAIDALAYSHFGTANADPVSIRRSFHSYGMAIQSMSAKLVDMERDKSGFATFSEDDWQHFAFFCLVMTFWEMKVSPASRNWQSHMRCLTNAIIERGTYHTWSDINVRLLATSRLLLTLQVLSTRESNDWHHNSPVRTAWLGEIKSALGEPDSPKPSTEHDLYHSLDSLMADAASIGSITAQFHQLQTRTITTSKPEVDDFNRILLGLYDTAETILARTEVQLANWNIRVCVSTRPSWMSFQSDPSITRISDGFWSSMNMIDLQSDFDTVLTFHSLLEYHAITLHWTIIVSLRLLLNKILALMEQKNTNLQFAHARQKIQDNRIQLMDYAVRVLQTTCYATHAETNAATPFAVVTAFQLSVAVLERECKFLLAEGGDESVLGIRRCKGLRDLAARYIDWAVQTKIPIKIDLDD